MQITAMCLKRSRTLNRMNLYNAHKAIKIKKEIKSSAACGLGLPGNLPKWERHTTNSPDRELCTSARSAWRPGWETGTSTQGSGSGSNHGYWPETKARPRKELIVIRSLGLAGKKQSMTLSDGIVYIVKVNELTNKQNQYRVTLLSIQYYATHFTITGSDYSPPLTNSFECLDHARLQTWNNVEEHVHQYWCRAMSLSEKLRLRRQTTKEWIPNNGQGEQVKMKSPLVMVRCWLSPSSRRGQWLYLWSCVHTL